MGSIQDVLDLEVGNQNICVSIEDSCTTDVDWLASRNNDYAISMPQVDTLTSKDYENSRKETKIRRGQLFLNTLQVN